MDTPRQGDLFRDAPDARECCECGRRFVPAEEHHQYCDECFERREKRRKKPGESNTQWIERFYGQPS